jgi:hypothetical protein
MRTVRWGSRDLDPVTLFSAAREARQRAWLGETERRFLHSAGLALAGGRGLRPADAAQLDGLLHTLQRLGCTALGSPAGTPGGPDRAAADRLLAELRQVEALLASALERLEACREQLEGHLRSGRGT